MLKFGPHRFSSHGFTKCLLFSACSRCASVTRASSVSSYVKEAEAEAEAEGEMEDNIVARSKFPGKSNRYLTFASTVRKAFSINI